MLAVLNFVTKLS